MTVKVKKSQLRGIDFEDAVKRHAAEMNDWQAHMARVEADAKNDKIAPEQKHSPYPAPQASDLVTSALTETNGKWEPDFEIVNDDPAPEHVLRTQKNALLALISEMEREAIFKIVPPGKRRALEIREADILHREGQRHRELQTAEAQRRADAMKKFEERRADLLGQKSKGLFGQIKETAKAAVGIETDAEKTAKAADALHDRVQRELTDGPDAEKIAETIRAERSSEDADFIEKQNERRAKIDAIHRHAAALAHDVEDLTSANVERWAPKPFPT